jgi:hypothetical protein
LTTSSTWQELLESPGGHDHIAQTYQDDAFLLEALGHYVRAGLQRGEGVLLIMRKDHWVTLVTELGALGVDLIAAVERGQVRSSDADEILAGLMKAGRPDHNTFRQMVGSVLEGMRHHYRHILAFGEMVDILWRDGRRKAALELEQLWNELARVGPFALLCGYRVDPLDRALYSGSFEDVCKLHTNVIPARDYLRLDDAVNQASREVMDPPTVMMLESLAARHKPRTDMPPGQAVLLWLSLNMPRTADKVMARVRALYPSAS